MITTTLSTNYPDYYNCEGGFLIKAGFGARLINSNYVSEVREQWREPLVNQVALNWQTPNQGCTTVSAKQGVSLPPVSHKRHSFVHPFSSYPTLPDYLGYGHMNTLTFASYLDFKKL